MHSNARFMVGAVMGVGFGWGTLWLYRQFSGGSVTPPSKSTNEKVESDGRVLGRGKRVIIAGAPGSGKGTQSDYIAAHFGLVHIASGDLLRSEVRKGTPNGLKAQTYMNSGALVPNEIVDSIVSDRLKQSDCVQNGTNAFFRFTASIAAQRSH